METSRPVGCLAKSVQSMKSVSFFRSGPMEWPLRRLYNRSKPIKTIPSKPTFLTQAPVFAST